MNRFHVNLTVSSLKNSVEFYSHLFDVPPSVEKDDYAKWMLDDPRINFSLSTHGTQYGIDHVGIQVENIEELAKLRKRLEKPKSPVFEQTDTDCCYANSTKAWIRDPDDVAWETFLTHGETTVYGDGSEERAGNVVVAGAEQVSVITPKQKPMSCCHDDS